MKMVTVTYPSGIWFEVAQDDATPDGFVELILIAIDGTFPGDPVEMTVADYEVAMIERIAHA